MDKSHSSPSEQFNDLHSDLWGYLMRRRRKVGLKVDGDLRATAEEIAHLEAARASGASVLTRLERSDRFST